LTGNASLRVKVKQPLPRSKYFKYRMHLSYLLFYLENQIFTIGTDIKSGLCYISWRYATGNYNQNYRESL
jgi:hypothetical protein